MEPTTTDLTQEETKITEDMDKATQELSSFIGFLCEKYNAEFIVQKVIFSFLPKQVEIPIISAEPSSSNKE